MALCYLDMFLHLSSEGCGFRGTSPPQGVPCCLPPLIFPRTPCSTIKLAVSKLRFGYFRFNLEICYILIFRQFQ